MSQTIAGGESPIYKTPNAVQDWTAVVQNTIGKSAEINLDKVSRATMHIQAALASSVAHTGTRLVVQTSDKLSGDADWQPHTDFVALIGTATSDQIEDDPLAAGSTDIALTGHGLATEGVLLFIEDSTTANCEIVMVASSTANQVVILDGTATAHALNTIIRNMAAVINVVLPATAVRARLVIDNTYDSNGSTLAYAVNITTSTGV